VLVAVGLALVLLAGLGFGGLRLLVERYNNAVNKASLLDEQSRAGQTTLTGPLNYLLIGSDLRSFDPGGGQRSDTIVVVHIPEGLKKAYLISVPRDLLVDIPADPDTGYAGGRDKINAAFQYGQASPALLSQTLTDLMGIKFAGAAIVQFGGFKKVVDTLGGIEVCVDENVTSIHTGYQFKVGCQTMDGAQALDYARQRYDLPDGDYDRQRHQQQILKAIAQKVTDAGLVTNPIKLDQVIRAIGGALTVDTNGASLEDTVLAMRNLRPSDLVGVKVPSHADNIDGTSYAVLDPPSDGLFDALRDGTLDQWAAANPSYVNAL
jgi:LCP family protein required for cell wall assembly